MAKQDISTKKAFLAQVQKYVRPSAKAQSRAPSNHVSVAVDANAGAAPASTKLTPGEEQLVGQLTSVQSSLKTLESRLERQEQLLQAIRDRQGGGGCCVVS